MRVLSSVKSIAAETIISAGTCRNYNEFMDILEKFSSEVMVLSSYSSKTVAAYKSIFKSITSFREAMEGFKAQGVTTQGSIYTVHIIQDTKTKHYGIRFSFGNVVSKYEKYSKKLVISFGNILAPFVSDMIKTILANDPLIKNSEFYDVPLDKDSTEQFRQFLRANLKRSKCVVDFYFGTEAEFIFSKVGGDLFTRFTETTNWKCDLRDFYGSSFADSEKLVTSFLIPHLEKLGSSAKSKDLFVRTENEIK